MYQAVEEHMDKTPMDVISHYYRESHERVLRLVEDLTEEQLAWQLAPNTTSIAFHLWHLARWADHLQAAIPGMTPELRRRLGSGRQLWDEEDLAAQWGMNAATLGYAETGMLMDDDTAGHLAL